MKRQFAPFGNHISPDCACCIYSVGEDLECTLHLFIDIDGSCTRFSYDPLRRKPKIEPDFNKFDYKVEDFQL